MSYSRGILYVYEDVDKGFVCVNGAISNGYFVCDTRMEMIAHLRDHMETAKRFMFTDWKDEGINVEIFTKAWKACVRLYSEV